MIRILIGAAALDLANNTNIGFIFNNSLFGFDNIPLSRSTAFKIPATPYNNKILGFSNLPNMRGGAMRSELPASAEFAGGTLRGKVRVLSYSNGNYDCSFIWGELLGLQRLKSLGNIGEYTTFSDTVTTAEDATGNQYAGTGNVRGAFPYGFFMAQYWNGAGRQFYRPRWLPDYTLIDPPFNRMPVVRLDYLITKAANAAGVQIDYGIFAGGWLASLALVLNSAKKQWQTQNISISGAVEVGDNQNYTMSPAANAYLTLSHQVVTVMMSGLALGNVPGSIRFAALTAVEDLIITAPANANIAFVTGNGYEFLSVGGNNNDKWRGFDSGRVGIPKGTTFSIVPKAMWVEDFGGSYLIDVNSPPHTISITLTVNYNGNTAESEIRTGVGDVYSLQYNCPKVNLLDLIKTFAVMTEQAIVYEESATGTNPRISFFNYDFDKSNVKQIDNIISVDSIDCQFPPFAQKNFVEFDSEDYIAESEQVRFAYPLNDINSPAEKLLFKIPFSEGDTYYPPAGDMTTSGRYKVLYVHDFDVENYEIDQDAYPEDEEKLKMPLPKWKKTLGKLTLGTSYGQAFYHTYMLDSNYEHRFSFSCMGKYEHRLNPPWPTGAKSNLTKLLSSPTRITVKAFMWAFQFSQLKDKQVYSVNGVLCICLSATWNNNIATLIMLDVSQLS